MSGIYCTTYCNQGHDLRTGHPVGHECRIIPPAALAAERADDFETAQRILQATPVVYMKGRRKR